jgi:hypothetical protein
MKQVVMMIALACMLHTATAQDTTNQKKTVFKAYPLDFVVGPIFYVSELHFAFEHKVRKNQSFQIGFGFDYPQPVVLLANTMLSANPYILIGGRLDIAYRYYFKTKNPENVFGPYVGGEVRVVGLTHVGTHREEYYGYGSGPYNPSWTVESRPRMVMSNYNFTFGYHYNHKKFSLDIGASVGLRYHYFWRKYDNGSLEYNRRGNDIYGYYKKSPVGGSINFSLGRVF